MALFIQKSNPWIEDSFVHACSNIHDLDNEAEPHDKHDQIESDIPFEEGTQNTIPHGLLASHQYESNSTVPSRRGKIVQIIHRGGTGWDNATLTSSYDHGVCPPYVILHDGKHSAVAFLSQEAMISVGIQATSNASVVNTTVQPSSMTRSSISREKKKHSSEKSLKDCQSYLLYDSDVSSYTSCVSGTDSIVVTKRARRVENDVVLRDMALASISNYTISTILQCCSSSRQTHAQVIKSMDIPTNLRSHLYRQLNLDLLLCLYLQGPITIIGADNQGLIGNSVDVHCSVRLRQILRHHDFMAKKNLECAHSNLTQILEACHRFYQNELLRKQTYNESENSCQAESEKCKSRMDNSSTSSIHVWPWPSISITNTQQDLGTDSFEKDSFAETNPHAHELEHCLQDIQQGEVSELLQKFKCIEDVLELPPDLTVSHTSNMSQSATSNKVLTTEDFPFLENIHCDLDQTEGDISPIQPTPTIDEHDMSSTTTFIGIDQMIVEEDSEGESDSDSECSQFGHTQTESELLTEPACKLKSQTHILNSKFHNRAKEECDTHNEKPLTQLSKSFSQSIANLTEPGHFLTVTEDLFNPIIPDESEKKRIFESSMSTTEVIPLFFPGRKSYLPKDGDSLHHPSSPSCSKGYQKRIKRTDKNSMMSPGIYNSAQKLSSNVIKGIAGESNIVKPKDECYDSDDSDSWMRVCKHKHKVSTKSVLPKMHSQMAGEESEENSSPTRQSKHHYDNDHKKIVHSIEKRHSILRYSGKTLSMKDNHQRYCDLSNSDDATKTATKFHDKEIYINHSNALLKDNKIMLDKSIPATCFHNKPMQVNHSHFSSQGIKNVFDKSSPSLEIKLQKPKGVKQFSMNQFLERAKFVRSLQSHP